MESYRGKGSKKKVHSDPPAEKRRHKDTDQHENASVSKRTRLEGVPLDIEQVLLEIKSQLQEKHKPSTGTQDAQSAEQLIQKVSKHIEDLQQTVNHQAQVIKEHEEIWDTIHSIGFGKDDCEEDKDCELLLQFIEENNYTAVRAVCKVGIRRFCIDTGQPLYNACIRGDPTMVQMLLEAGATDGDSTYAQDPLHAVCLTHEEPLASILAKILLKYELMISATDKTLPERWLADKLNSLHLAVHRRLYNVVWILVNKKAWVLETCLYKGKPTTVWQLCGDDIDTRNSLLQFWTPRNHILHDKVVRATIRLVLLVAQRQKWPFDTNTIHHILSFVAFTAKWKTEEYDFKKQSRRTEKKDYPWCWERSTESKLYVRWRLKK